MPVKCQRPFVTLVGSESTYKYIVTGQDPWTSTGGTPYKPVTIKTGGCQFGTNGIPQLVFVNGKPKRFFVRTTARSGLHYMEVFKGTISIKTNRHNGPYWWGEGWSSNSYYQDFLSVPDRNWFETTDAEAELFSSAAGKCNDKVADQKAAILVTIAEAQKTIDSIADTARTFAKGLAQIKKGDFIGAYRTLMHGEPRIGKGGIPLGFPKGETPATSRSLASNWLSYRYGWTPTFLDAIGIAEQTADTMISLSHTAPIWICENRKYSSKLISNSHHGTGTPEGMSDYNLVKLDLTLSLWLKGRIKDNGMKTLQEWGIPNFASVAWELVPLSFVVDWFLPVSDCLAFNTQYMGVEIIDIGYHTIHTIESVHSKLRDAKTSSKYSSYGSTPSRVKVRYYNRTPLSLEMLRPKFEPQLNINKKRLIDAVALFRNIAFSR